ncbi:DUF4124 domain-containing protein [Uliginosibacterium sp. H1]|uniref:DUF4124 domain-containing protein n=1 Tax=Uliginosibacterium sp. H1 TaxID=3114757 RepID=UPI002E183FB0|nr:DUF4124 domain-containing protein [Uliginosibacterium sp. H1]
MIPRIVLFLLLAAGSAWYFLDWNPAHTWRQIRGQIAAPEPTPMYRWRDARGGIVYGNQPPPGVKAERASGGTVSVLTPPVPRPLPAAAPAAASDPLAGGKTIRDLATERAIEGATK